MRTDLVSLPASMPLIEVERTLSEARVGGAPVVDGAGNVLGVVSMRDLFERYAEDPDARPCRGRDAEAFPLEEVLDADEEAPFASRDLDAQETAADVMSGQVRSVPPTADLGEIAREMVTHRVHRLLVKDGERYVGLIGTFDVLDALAG
jgi:CBS domain-containing protein